MQLILLLNLEALDNFFWALDYFLKLLIALWSSWLLLKPLEITIKHRFPNDFSSCLMRLLKGEGEMSSFPFKKAKHPISHLCSSGNGESSSFSFLLLLQIIRVLEICWFMALDASSSPTPISKASWRFFQKTSRKNWWLLGFSLSWKLYSWAQKTNFVFNEKDYKLCF